MTHEGESGRAAFAVAAFFLSQPFDGLRTEKIGMSGRNREEKKECPSTGSGRTGRRPSTLRSNSGEPALGTNEGGRIHANKHRKLQLTQSKRKLFGRAAKADFLEWFAATANLGWSARQAGFNYKTVLKHRMNDPVFAEAYDRALRQGFARLLGQQLETEIAAGEEAPIGIEGDRDVPAMQKMDPDRAILLLREHGRYLAGKEAGAGEARKQGRRPRVATGEEVRAAMAKALAAFEKRVRAMGYVIPDHPPSGEDGAGAAGAG